MSVVRASVLLCALFAALAAASSAGAANECDGLMVCVPIAGPWVVVPVSGSVPRPQVEFQLACPRGYVVGGLDARLSDRAVDVSFLGTLGSPVNPGITTSRSAVFLATYVGASARAPSFKPFIGCMPGAGGGSRVPTSASSFTPGRPTTRRVTNVRIRPGSATVTQRCANDERLVAASHALGFYTRTPPSPSIVASVSAGQSIHGRDVVVSVHADAELGGVRAVVQVHAVCTRAR
jgi:hypothetical protein